MRGYVTLWAGGSDTNAGDVGGTTHRFTVQTFGETAQAALAQKGQLERRSDFDALYPVKTVPLGELSNLRAMGTTQVAPGVRRRRFPSVEAAAN